MIDVVIGFDKEKGEFNLYEPTTDTLLITTSLGELFIKFDEFLKLNGLIQGADILNTAEINYHIDSATFIAMVSSNASLLKRLNTAPSGFMISSQRFGIQNNNFQNNNNQKGDFKDYKKKYNRSTGTFSKSSFNSSNKKFGNK